MNNDTYTLQEHIALVSIFLTNGKETESGEVEELIIEDFNVFSKNDAACLCFIAKYKSYSPNDYSEIRRRESCIRVLYDTSNLEIVADLN